MNVMFFLRWLAFAIFVIWFVVYWQAGRKALIDLHSAAQSRETDSRLDSFLMLSIGVLSLVVAATVVWSLLDQNSPLIADGLVVLGVILTAVGVGGMFTCRHQLGRFWTAETTLRQDHAVVDQGMYGIVRHPIYTFAIMMYVGLGLAFAVWWNVLAVVGIALAYMLKARDEEIFLVKCLPGYRDYQRRVRHRLIPYIW